MALKALAKVRDNFYLSGEMPADVIEFVKRRMVGKATQDLFSYIPEGQLEKVLTPLEIEFTGRRSHVGQIILWYQSSWCTKAVVRIL